LIHLSLDLTISEILQLSPTFLNAIKASSSHIDTA